MLTSLAFIFLVGLSLAAICQRIRLPRIIGVLVTGILLGPSVLVLLYSQHGRFFSEYQGSEEGRTSGSYACVRSGQF